MISRISPTSGLVGVAYPIEVVIEGNGFAAEGNTVTFGSIEIRNLESSEDGTRISFMAPKQEPATGGAAPMVLLPGQYEITVTTSRQVSAPVVFELVRGGQHAE